MLTPVSRALVGWKPGGKRSKSPHEQALGAVTELWPAIVGEDVARHAAPIEIKADALLVLTSSSAWSNQLSLLAGPIICALSEAGIDGIERLRFRIGRIRRVTFTHGPERSNGKSPAALPSAPVTSSSTAEEALLRFRKRVEGGRDAKRADGWNPCSTCGVLLSEGSRCAPCAAAELSARSARVQRLMFDVPWLGFSGIADLVEGFTREEYEANRTTLLARWWEILERARKTGKLSSDGLERQIASSYLLLLTEWAPERITPAVARSQLGEEIYQLMYEHHNTQKS